MERGSRRSGIELLQAADGLARGQRLDFDSPLAQELERYRVRTEAAVGARSDHQALRELVEDPVEIVEDEAVAVAPPPVADDSVGQDDEVGRLLVPVDDDAAEAVALDAGP